MFNLDGRVAFVTGAARGLGFAIGQAFLRAGATVTFADIDAPGLDAAAARIREEMPEAVGRAFFVIADVSDTAGAVAVLGETYQRAGRLDILVNNAGLAELAEFLDLEVGRLRRTFEVNVIGPFALAQAAGQWMKRAGYGRIINVSSISGVRASLGRSSYGTSKAALIHLTKQMAMELGQYGITANLILPGPVDTELARRMHTAETRSAYYEAIPLGRYGREEEVAAAALFLASSEASYVNGLELAVDGGLLAAGIKFSDVASKAAPKSGGRGI